MTIKILGSGCKKCTTLEERVKEVVSNNNIETSVEKVTDLNEMINYGIMMTPALVVNDEVVSVGIIPKDEQILSWIKGK